MADKACILKLPWKAGAETAISAEEFVISPVSGKLSLEGKVRVVGLLRDGCAGNARAETNVKESSSRTKKICKGHILSALSLSIRICRR